MTETDLRRRSSSCRSRSAGLLACSSSSRKEEREAAGREGGGGGAGNRKGALEERELPNCVSEEREREAEGVRSISIRETLMGLGQNLQLAWPNSLSRCSPFLFPLPGRSNTLDVRLIAIGRRLIGRPDSWTVWPGRRPWTILLDRPGRLIAINRD